MAYSVKSAAIELKWENTVLDHEIVENLIRPLKNYKKLTDFATTLLLSFGGSPEDRLEQVVPEYTVLHDIENAKRFQRAVMEYIMDIISSTNELQTMRCVQKLSTMEYKDLQHKESANEVIESALVKISWNHGDPDYRAYDLILLPLQKSREITAKLKQFCLYYYTNIHKYPGFIPEELYSNIVEHRRPVILFNEFIREFDAIRYEIQSNNRTRSKTDWDDLIFFIKQKSVLLEEYLIDPDFVEPSKSDGRPSNVVVQGSNSWGEILMDIVTRLGALESKLDDNTVVVEYLASTVKDLHSMIETKVAQQVVSNVVTEVASTREIRPMVHVASPLVKNESKPIVTTNNVPQVEQEEEIDEDLAGLVMSLGQKGGSK